MSARRDYVLARRACWVESMPGSQRASLMIAVGPYALSAPRALYLERPHRAAYTSLGLAVTCHKLSRHTYYTVQSPRPRLALRSPRSIRLKDIRPGPAGGTNRGDITVLLIVRATTGHIQSASIPPQSGAEAIDVALGHAGQARSGYLYFRKALERPLTIPGSDCGTYMRP